MEHVELEGYRTPLGYVYTSAVAAVGSDGNAAMVIALGEANAYRQLARHLRDGLPSADMWAVPLPLQQRKRKRALRDPDLSPDPSDPAELVAARAELEAVMQSGWKLHSLSCEPHRWSAGSVRICGLAAEGPDGQAELALGLERAGAYRAMAKRFKGELEIEEAWVPPLRNTQEAGGFSS